MSTFNLFVGNASRLAGKGTATSENKKVKRREGRRVGKRVEDVIQNTHTGTVIDLSNRSTDDD